MNKVFELFEHQQEFIDAVPGLPEPARACLYYKTGSGKSLTALLGMKELGYGRVLVIAPPSTHASWMALGWQHDMQVVTISHAKFRMKDYRAEQHMPVIADEFHMFGGQQGQGWRKLEGLARGLKAPLFLLSATPNYNDAERVYCVQRILSPHVSKGGFLQFLYENCTTEQNPFSMTPKVTGFKDYPDAAAFLADMARVFYVEDDLKFSITDIPYPEDVPAELTEMMYDRRRHRIVASEIELRHTVRYQGLVAQDGGLQPAVMAGLLPLLQTYDSVLIFTNHATVAQAVSLSLARRRIDYRLITGSTSKKDKERMLAEYVADGGGVLVGTASIATGTDGLDRVCDTLIILDDTDDDALRRQLVGRIMPRGASSSTSAVKKVLRFSPF